MRFTLLAVIATLLVAQQASANEWSAGGMGDRVYDAHRAAEERDSHFAEESAKATAARAVAARKAEAKRGFTSGRAEGDIGNTGGGTGPNSHPN